MSGHAGPHSEGDRKRKETTPPEAPEDESVQRKALSVNGLVKQILQFVPSESDFKALVLVCVNPASRREYEPMFRDVQSMARLEKDVTKMIMTTVGTYSCTKAPASALASFLVRLGQVSLTASATQTISCLFQPADFMRAYSALWDLQIGDVKNLKTVPDLLYSEGLLLSVMTRFQTMLAKAMLSRRRLGTLRQSWDIYKAALACVAELSLRFNKSPEAQTKGTTQMQGLRGGAAVLRRVFTQEEIEAAGLTQEEAQHAPQQK